MAKAPSKELIDEEKDTLEIYKKKKKELESKWIKLPSTLRFIEFLEYYLKEKEKFLEILRNYLPKKN